MKRCMKKLWGIALVIAMLCGVMIPVTSKAADAQESITVEVMPAEQKIFKKGDTIGLKISGIDKTKWSEIYYFLNGPFGETGVEEGETQVEDDGTALISAEITEERTGTPTCYLELSGITADGQLAEGGYNTEFKLCFTIEPKITIVSLEPQGDVYSSTLMNVKVKAENLDKDKSYFVFIPGLANSEEVDITGKESAEVTVPARASMEASMDEGDLFWANLYERTGTGENAYKLIAESESMTYTVKERTQLSLSWNPIGEAVAGTAYPFSVAVKNVSDETLTNLVVNINTPRHVKDSWSPQITWQEQTGVTPEGANATIGSLGAGEAITLKGTITFPADAVGDGTHVNAELLWNDGNGVTQLGHVDTRGETDSAINIVAQGTPQGAGGTGGPGQGGNGSAGQNGNGSDPQLGTRTAAAQTGDTAPIMTVFAAMVMSVLVGFAAWRRKYGKI